MILLDDEDKDLLEFNWKPNRQGYLTRSLNKQSAHIQYYLGRVIAERMGIRTINCKLQYKDKDMYNNRRDNIVMKQKFKL